MSSICAPRSINKIGSEHMLLHTYTHTRTRTNITLKLFITLLHAICLTTIPLACEIVSINAAVFVCMHKRVCVYINDFAILRHTHATSLIHRALATTAHTHKCHVKEQWRQQQLFEAPAPSRNPMQLKILHLCD